MSDQGEFRPQYFSFAFKQCVPGQDRNSNGVTACVQIDLLPAKIVGHLPSRSARQWEGAVQPAALDDAVCAVVSVDGSPVLPHQIADLINRVGPKDHPLHRYSLANAHYLGCSGVEEFDRLGDVQHRSISFVVRRDGKPLEAGKVSPGRLRELLRYGEALLECLVHHAAPHHHTPVALAR